ncbi:MAG: hypothetical protein H0T76_10860 [Nannocystis sp.]|nr:hypothetical protein [Nannocystis sp.]MBA3546973.1 hypothetical protein [Nannocystis sp.]
MNLVKTALTYVAVFSVGAVTSVSCFEPDLENPSFRCNPSEAAKDPDAACPDKEVCCSDDPATQGGLLPNYTASADKRFGVPIFSSNNNQLSVSGMCVEIGFPTPLLNGCPIPCNPTWELGDVTAVCGAGVACCQVQELDPVKDCVVDPVTKKWRAVTGEDIGTVTKWGGVHATNQDPQGAGCGVFAGNDATATTDCYDQLSVANQRGFCFKACPCIEDVCAQRNLDYVPRCGGAVVPPGV